MQSELMVMCILQICFQGMMQHWYVVVSVLVMAVLVANYVLLRHRLDHCLLHEIVPRRDERNLSAAALVKEHGSSVWCWGRDHTSRLCRFTNLCYLPQHDAFTFFHHPNGTVVSGVPKYET